MLVLGVKDQLTKENEELKQRNGALDQQKDELDVRMTALKSQYEGRISRLERELREHQERHLEQRDEPQEPTNKVTSWCAYVTNHMHMFHLKMPGYLGVCSNLD